MDQLPTTDNDQMNISAQPEKGFEKTVIKKTENLITQHARFSLLAQIYQWQPTGVLLRLSLPIINADNSPLFALRVSPFWMPLNYFMARRADLTSWIGGTTFYFYDRMKSWAVPVAMENTVFSEQVTFPSAIRVIESDDMPDITLHALHHLAWSGTIQYMFKIISNTTTQGKIMITRQYNVFRPKFFKDPMTHKTVMQFMQTSQSNRRKNAFIVEDLAKTTDLQIDCPYVDRLPYRNIPMEIERASTGPGNATANFSQEQLDSWIFLDIIGALDVSAGSTSTLIEFWIKAGPDFQLHGPSPFSSHFLRSRYSYAKDGRPIQFELNDPTIRITGINSFTTPA